MFVQHQVKQLSLALEIGQTHIRLAFAEWGIATQGNIQIARPTGHQNIMRDSSTSHLEHNRCIQQPWRVKTPAVPWLTLSKGSLHAEACRGAEKEGQVWLRHTCSGEEVVLTHGRGRQPVLHHWYHDDGKVRGEMGQRKNAWTKEHMCAISQIQI